MSKIKRAIKKFWNFLRQDSWKSWLVSLLIAFVIIKFIFFPLLSLAMGTKLPLVIVESCSMYHEAGFDDWWQRNSAWYENAEIGKKEFESFPLKNGLNKGDIVVVSGSQDYKTGEIIVFEAGSRYPLIHRVVEKPTATKGDHNAGQLEIERNIEKDKIIGKAVARLPAVGWLKLVFFDFSRPENQRGFCE